MMNKLILASAVFSVIAYSAMAQEMSLSVGQVSVVPVSTAPGSVVVGNPKVADVAVEGNAVMVMGVGAGETDLVILGTKKEVLYSGRVAVRGAGDLDAVVVRGAGDAGVTDAVWECPPGRPCAKRSAGK